MARVLSRHEQQERTRERLLDSAGAVFARRGYHGAKVAEIAREAGYTTGAVYSNFDGKRGLFLALADREIAKRVEVVGAIATAAELFETNRDEIGAHFEQFLDESGRWAFLFVEFWSQNGREDELAPEWRERRDAVRRVLADAIESEATARGRTLVLPAAEIAMAIRATLNGLTFDRAVDREELPGRAAAWAIGSLLRAASKPTNE